MIKVVLLGMICLGSIGAIAAASRSGPVQAPPVTYPVVSGIKADRLSLVSLQDVPPVIEKATLPVGPLAVSSVPNEPLPKEQPVKAKAAPDFVPRHWHDPHDARTGAIKPRSTRSVSASRSSPATTGLASAQDCRSDGLGSLMRKLNLQPTCSR